MPSAILPTPTPQSSKKWRRVTFRRVHLVADSWDYPFVTASSRFRIARATIVQSAHLDGLAVSRTGDPGGVEFFVHEPLPLPLVELHKQDELIGPRRASQTTAK